MDKVIESKQKKLKHFSERYCAIEAQITKLKKQQKDILEKKGFLLKN